MRQKFRAQTCFNLVQTCLMSSIFISVLYYKNNIFYIDATQRQLSFPSISHHIYIDYTYAYTYVYKSGMYISEIYMKKKTLAVYEKCQFSSSQNCFKIKINH